MLKSLWKIVAGVIGVCVFMASPAFSDPCLMVYSDSPAVYHYDPAEHYTVGPGHMLYDPVYDRDGKVLIDANTGEIAYNVYQAPNLLGFQLDMEHQGYFILGSEFTAIVDGFNNAPITYENVLLVFDTFEPAGCVPSVTIDGNPALFDAGLGLYWPLGDLTVSTPTADGNNYSDTWWFSISWGVCSGVRAYAFSDDNYNLVRDGNECFSAFSHDITIPVEDRTWGAIKSLYSE
jgi:hypothetical protein